MHTIELTDEELKLLQTAVRSFFDDFGHDEKDVLRQLRALLDKLQDA
jgi:hypothetical protein